MITEIFISYPWWTLLPVIALGLLYAGLLYYKNPLNKLGTSLSTILFLVRFFVVFVLGFLLLSPTIKTKNKQIEKPIIIIGQDNSKSILMTKDAVYYTDELAGSINKLVAELSLKNDVDSYLFGESVGEGLVPDYGDSESDYSEFLSHVKQNYIGLNVGAIILSGDGIVNNGVDPVYAASDINLPIFTIALGDTSQSRDAKIDDVRYNSIVYLGDIFPIEISLSATKLKGSKAVLSLLENNKLISKKAIQFSNDNFRKSIKFAVEAKSAGKRRYKLVLEPVVGEINTENNNRNIFVDVLDSRQKILILAYAPHPDIGAIKQSLLKNKNYQVETKYISEFDGSLKEYDLVILHQLPAKGNSAIGVLNEIVKYEIPLLYVLGGQSNIAVFNQYFNGLNILSSVGSTVSGQFEYNNLFTYFSFKNELAIQLASMPPLSTPLGNYSVAEGAEVFGWQIINGILTDFPLIVFNNNLGIKTGVISGEGIWLWRIHDQLRYNNSIAVDAFISKAAMFLIAATDKRHFRIKSKGEYDSHGDVVIHAELYNQAFELENTPDVSLTLTNEVGEKFNFVFSPFDDYYKLNFNKLPIGIYKYIATVKFGTDEYSDKGEFIVQQLDNESKKLNANHRMLNKLAIEHEGAMYHPDEIDILLEEINNLNSITSKIHYEDKFIGINSLIYILVGLIFLLSLEWFIRKYFGNY